MGLEGFAISDLFFPEVCWFLVLPLVLYILFALKVNLVNRIKKDEVIKNITINLQRKLEAFEDTADILRIYPNLNCQDSSNKLNFWKPFETMGTISLYF